MSHFKTLFILAIFFIARASFAMDCMKDHSKAQEICYKDTYSWVKIVEDGKDEDALNALNFIRKVHLDCFYLIVQCKKSCQFESKSTDTNDLRAFSSLLNCESGDISRSYQEKLSDKLIADKAASKRNLTRPVSERQDRTSETSQGLTTLPGLMPAIR